MPIVVRKLLFVLAASWLALTAESKLFAQQYVTNYQGREVVVHTYRLPVIMHRLVPPQLGRHVTANEIESGNVRSLAPNRTGSVR